MLVSFKDEGGEAFFKASPTRATKEENDVAPGGGNSETRCTIAGGSID